VPLAPPVLSGRHRAGDGPHGIQACAGPDCAPHLQSAPHLPSGAALGSAARWVHASDARAMTGLAPAASPALARTPALAARPYTLEAAAPPAAHAPAAPAAFVVEELTRRGRRLMLNASLAQGGVVPGGAPNNFSPPEMVPNAVNNSKAVKNAALEGTVDGAVEAVKVVNAGVEAAVTGAVSHAINEKQARPPLLAYDARLRLCQRRSVAPRGLVA